MNHLASLLILTSGLAHAIVNAILKAGKDKMSGRALIDGFSALLLAPAAFFVPLPTHAWGWLAGSWLAHVAYLVCLIRAFEQADMSVAYPISRGLAPTLTAACAVLLFGESINAYTAVGIGLVSAGVLAIGASHTLQARALVWAVLTGACVAAYTVIDAQGVRAAPSAASYIVWVFLAMGVGIALGFAAWRGRAFVQAASQQWKPGVIAGTLSIFTYGLALIAFRLGATPRLAALRETSILFGTAIAFLVLKERLTRARWLGIFAIAGGAAMLIARG